MFCLPQGLFIIGFWGLFFFFLQYFGCLVSPQLFVHHLVQLQNAASSAAFISARQRLLHCFLVQYYILSEWKSRLYIFLSCWDTPVARSFGIYAIFLSKWQIALYLNLSEWKFRLSFFLSCWGTPVAKSLGIYVIFLSEQLALSYLMYERKACLHC